MKGYNDNLANEWINWVETRDPPGIREKEIIPFIKKWLDKLKPNVLCDIGCGQGACSELINKTTEYIGADPSETLLKRARKLYSSPNKKFINGNAYNIPLENGSVDALISIWVWSHLDNLKLAAKEICRVLKTDGRFLIVTANPETYEERKTFYKNYTVKDNLLKGTFDLGNGKVLTDTTLYLHSRNDMEVAIKQAGLKINKVTRLGQSESSNKGLYIVFEGSK